MQLPVSHIEHAVQPPSATHSQWSNIGPLSVLSEAQSCWLQTELTRLGACIKHVERMSGSKTKTVWPANAGLQALAGARVVELRTTVQCHASVLKSFIFYFNGTRIVR
jgi:hypothetical protein